MLNSTFGCTFTESFVCAIPINPINRNDNVISVFFIVYLKILTVKVPDAGSSGKDTEALEVNLTFTVFVALT